jgi:hypothetical protein
MRFAFSQALNAWHGSLCGPAAVKVVAESDARHLERIRKVEGADAESNLPGVREPKLCADVLLKGEIQVGVIGRESLLCISHDAVQREVGLQDLAVSPEHAEADRRYSETGYCRAVAALAIAVFVLYCGLPQESNRQNLANVIHARTDGFAPGMPNRHLYNALESSVRG